MKFLLGETPENNMVMTFRNPCDEKFPRIVVWILHSPIGSPPPKIMTPCRLLPIVSILAVGLTAMAKAAPLPLDSGWTILNSSPNGENVAVPTPGSPYVFGGGPWVIDAVTPFKLTVTDLFSPGDLFQVWNNGSLLGSGSGIDGLYSFALTPDAALVSPNFSHNSWMLQPGSYSFDFKVTQFAPNFKNTQIAFKAESQPVPDGGSTVLLLGMALAGIAGIRKIRGLVCRA